MEVGVTTMNKPTEHGVYIGRTDDGKYVAAAATAPYFCFLGDSEDEVRETARRALNFYFGEEGYIATVPHKVAPTTRPQISRLFRPKLEKIILDSVTHRGTPVPA